MPVETRLRVRFAETDQMGVVYYANYFVWMELGRVEWCRARGVRYKDMEEKDGILLMVAEASCRYRTPARYDEEVVVSTRASKSHARLVKFEYRMVGAESGAELASGETVHVFCGRDLRPVKLPEKYREAFHAA